MKKIFLVAIMVLCGALIHVIADEVKVTMNNGTVFTGELKEFVPTDHITVVVAGIETTISISEVASVERPNVQNTMHNRSYGDTNLQYGKYVVTDTKEYPESFTLKIGDQELTMVLVRGGWFNMGYDGRHSLSWDSEPIHRVTLSSYYVSTQYLNCHVSEALLKKKEISSSVKPYNCKYRKDADELITEINMLSNAPYRLLTEAEWEYAALMPFANAIFGNNKNVEWCSDFFEKYSAADQINPQGPSSGKNHVLRSYSSDNGKWKRMQGSGNKDWYPDAYIRIAINADQMHDAEHSSISLPIPDSHLDFGTYEITDTKQYPDSFALKVGNQELTMILVRGGWFNMGYDGKHSSSWDSEPVHQVTLSSFYISKQSHRVNSRQNAVDLLSSLAKSTAMSYRLPTEAEWEYAALMPFAENIFSETGQLEWCSDFWAQYSPGNQIDPQGPSKGESHVLRAYSRNNEKWRRFKGYLEFGKEIYIRNTYIRDQKAYNQNENIDTQNENTYIRIAISADQIMNNQ